MGYYSFTCAKTGLPISTNDCGCDPKFFEAVVLTPNGSFVRGEYNGYGRVGDFDDLGEQVMSGKFKMALAHFYRGESYDALLKSKDDPLQGGYDEYLHPLMFDAQERFPGFDGFQYSARLREFRLLERALDQHMESVFGLSIYGAEELSNQIDRGPFFDEVDPATWTPSRWSDVLASHPDGVIPAGHALHGKTPEEAVELVRSIHSRMMPSLANEVMDAWVGKRPTRTPVFIGTTQPPLWKASAPTQTDVLPKKPRP